MKKLAAAIAFYVLAVSSSQSVILLETGDPSVNTAPPDGTLQGSGWQYQGDWGSFLGTPIAPNFFISAAHIGLADVHLSFQGSYYTLVRSFGLPGSDFLIWQVNETFPTFAPIYSKNDEAGQHLVVIGRGTERGTEIMLDGTLRGWNWGGNAGTRRWGENDVASVVPYSGHDLLYATFDKSAQPNESHLSSGDSGGAVFLNDSGTWKLAGINYAVDDLYSAPDPATKFNAAIFDARGFYQSDEKNPPTFTQITGSTAVPTGFYASRISSELAWICSVIANPQVNYEAGELTVTYWRLVASTNEITYTVQQSVDLNSWSPATTTDEILATAGDLELVKATIHPGDSTFLFARLQVMRP